MKDQHDITMGQLANRFAIQDSCRAIQEKIDDFDSWLNTHAAFIGVDQETSYEMIDSIKMMITDLEIDSIKMMITDLEEEAGQ